MAANFPSHSILTSPSQKERNPDGRPDKTKTQTYISSYYSAAKIPNHSDTRVRSEATRAKRSRLKSIVSGPRTWRLLDAFHKKKIFFFFYLSGCLRAAVSRLGLTWFPALPPRLRALPRLPWRRGGCGAASRSSAAAPVGAGVRAGFLLATCVRSFPAPTGSSAEGKNFSLVTPPGIAVWNSLPAWVKSRIQLGAPGTRNPGAARLRGGGRGRRPPRSRGTTRGPRGRGRGARPGLGRARPPPPQPRSAGIVSSAPAAPCARPPGRHRSEPEPTGRAGRLRGGRPSVGPSVRPARPLPPRLPAAVPLAAAAARSPPGLLLRSSLARAEDRGCVARRRATFQSSGRRTGEGRRGRGEKKRRRTRAGPGWREFLPHRPRRQQRHRPGG